MFTFAAYTGRRSLTAALTLSIAATSGGVRFEIATQAFSAVEISSVNPPCERKKRGKAKTKGNNSGKKKKKRRNLGNEKIVLGARYAPSTTSLVSH